MLFSYSYLPYKRYLRDQKQQNRAGLPVVSFVPNALSVLKWRAAWRENMNHSVPLCHFCSDKQRQRWYISRLMFMHKASASRENAAW